MIRYPCHRYISVHHLPFVIMVPWYAFFFTTKFRWWDAGQDSIVGLRLLMLHASCHLMFHLFTFSSIMFYVFRVLSCWIFNVLSCFMVFYFSCRFMSNLCFHFMFHVIFFHVHFSCSFFVFIFHVCFSFFMFMLSPACSCSSLWFISNPWSISICSRGFCCRIFLAQKILHTNEMRFDFCL